MLAISIQKYYIFVLLFLLAILQSSCQQSGNKYRILVVHSYESDYVAYKDCDRLIRESLEKKGINPSIQTFYLNCEQYAAPAEEKRMYLYLDSISTWKPDLILVYEDQATYTLMQCHHPLISTVPIVFGGVNFPNKALLAQYSNVSGFWDEPDYVTNIRLIEHLLGKSTIYMLHDSTYIDRHIKATLHEQCAQADIRVDNNRIMYIPVEIATLDRVNQSLKRPDSTTVNVVPVQGDKLSAVSWYMSKHVPYIYYLQAKRDYRVLNTSRFSSKPSFTAINEDLGYSNKLVGGYITSLETQIEESTDRAAEILKGSPSESFPQITKSKKNYVFVIPVEEELDLKKAAKAANEKSIEMLKSKELLPLTGYVHGGCSPIGMKKVFTTFLHSTAKEQEHIIFSAGKIGYQVEVAPEDLAKVVRFTFADVIK